MEAIRLDKLTVVLDRASRCRGIYSVASARKLMPISKTCGKCVMCDSAGNCL
jgi:hypothetical protein